MLAVAAHVKLSPQLERKRSAGLQVPHVTRASQSSVAHIMTALDMTSDRKPAASPDFRASNSLLCMRMAEVISTAARCWLGGQAPLIKQCV